MKALLESSINWNNIKKRPKDNYMYYVRQAAIERETNTLALEVGLNFLPADDDMDKFRAILKTELPQIASLDVKVYYMEAIPEKAEIIRAVVENGLADKGKNGNVSQKNINQNGRKRSYAAKDEPIIGNQLMGKPIVESITDIADIYSGMGIVSVEGQIFRKESRKLKNGKQLISYLITDFSDSSCIKAFVSEKKCEEINGLLDVGDSIRVRGKVEFDKFEEADVIMARDLVKVETAQPTDDAVNKRVELHAHTKMSAMDGLADVQDLISTAAAYGHKAVAITDHGVVQSFPDAAKHVKSRKLDIKLIYGLEGYLVDDEQPQDDRFDYKTAPSYHIILLAQTQKGIENLYRLVSISHLEYFYRRPRIPKSVLRAHKEGIIVGSACEAGEIFKGVLKGLNDEGMGKIIDIYDYLEIQPLINNRFLIDGEKVADEEQLKELNKRIIRLGERFNKPVVATCDVHYIKEREALYRRILMAGQGYKDAESGEGLYFRTTQEMLDEFSYLGEDVARAVVIENPNRIADAIEKVAPVPDDSFRPEIPNADERLRETCMERAENIYGKPLPEEVGERLEKELNSIIGNGYAVLYISSEMLVKDSLAAGYIVGSRGSVGSSFAATMAGITEVNPLPPHYICPNPQCKKSEFITSNEYDCGVDLPDKICPNCGEAFSKDGFNIPFETFLGFEGDKEPDIDLNFAGEFQARAHKYVEEIFGEENVFRAGTISKVAAKTAYGFVRKYYEGKEQKAGRWETERLTIQCTGVRRTTGQHPGGIIILPKGHEIYEFCPIQRPANDMNSGVITTHYDYHSIDKNLLKLDILGHDVPSMLRMLLDHTGLDPLSVPLKDKKVDGIFNGTKDLDIKMENYPFTHGTYGIPEFGTIFVRQMLDDVKPKYFSDLIRISGLSHGTDVWINNAQNVIRENQADFREVICTRDDIMNGLISKGLQAKTAFKIMEKVRKGKGITEEEAKVMEEHKVPQWYIESCRKIGYMFPKAHAVAYVIMSYRIAYYKVYYPLAFYATFFTIKVADFNAETILGGQSRVWSRINEIMDKGKSATQKETDELTVLEVAYEMYARGYDFDIVDLARSKAVKFVVDNGKILPPFRAVAGVGDTAAINLADAVEQGQFLSIDDLQEKSKLNKTAIEALQNMGVLKELPETNQITLF